MQNQLLESYSSEKNFKKFAAPQIISSGFMYPGTITLEVLGLKFSILSVSQNLKSKHFEIWENFEALDEDSDAVLSKLNEAIKALNNLKSDFSHKLAELEKTGYPQPFYHSQLNEINNALNAMIESKEKIAAITWIK